MNTNDEEIKGFFTAYLDVALKREREDYINGKSKEEIPIDIETVDAEKQVEFEQNYEAMILEKLKEFSGTRKERGKNLLDGYGEELEKAVSYLEESEKMVILFKVYLELTYKEIGTIMGMSDRKAASIYHYARKKLLRRLEKEYGI